MLFVSDLFFVQIRRPSVRPQLMWPMRYVVVASHSGMFVLGAARFLPFCRSSFCPFEAGFSHAAWQWLMLDFISVRSLVK